MPHAHSHTRSLTSSFGRYYPRWKQGTRALAAGGACARLGPPHKNPVGWRKRPARDESRGAEGASVAKLPQPQQSPNGGREGAAGARQEKAPATNTRLQDCCLSMALTQRSGADRQPHSPRCHSHEYFGENVFAGWIPRHLPGRPPAAPTLPGGRRAVGRLRRSSGGGAASPQGGSFMGP